MKEIEDAKFVAGLYAAIFLLLAVLAFISV